MPLLVKTYVYETVTDEDTEYTGEELIDEREEILPLRDVKRLLYCAETSVYPATKSSVAAGNWVIVYTGQNWRNGEYGRESIFLYHTNGKRLKPHQLYRVWKIAGIAK